MRFYALLPCAALGVAAVAFAAVPQAVSYFAAPQVSAAFAHGAVLFDGQGTNYMVHASRRTSPGQCEIHSQDTDVIYVLEGGATFVTGGSCPDAKPTADGELRGSAIEGGETRQLAKGDVIIVPHGTPHWFKAVDGPVLYYVVKVR
jgi:mannose-6-phosphate isomerase-like protein (cupin superfamily)